MFEKLWQFFFGGPKATSPVNPAEPQPGEWHFTIETRTTFTADDEQIERWKLERPTWRQKLLIDRLGGNMSLNASKYDASILIDRLKRDEWRCEKATRLYEKEGYPPSPRQQMVARFWDVPPKRRKEEASEWQDEFYAQDPDRLKAWELWKKEHRTEEMTDDPGVVPQGIGPEYLKRIKERQKEIALKKQLCVERKLARANKPPKPPKPIKANPILRVDNSTGFRGVYRVRKKFRAQIGFNGKKRKLGYYDTAEEAAKAYDAAARRHLGPSAQVNFPTNSAQNDPPVPGSFGAGGQ
jgi:hypothetical protein